MLALTLALTLALALALALTECWRGGREGVFSPHGGSSF
jgi:hypothetical protein